MIFEKSLEIDWFKTKLCFCRLIKLMKNIKQSKVLNIFWLLVQWIKKANRFLLIFFQILAKNIWMTKKGDLIVFYSKINLILKKIFEPFLGKNFYKSLVWHFIFKKFEDLFLLTTFDIATHKLFRKCFVWYFGYYLL